MKNIQVTKVSTSHQINLYLLLRSAYFAFIFIVFSFVYSFLFGGASVAFAAATLTLSPASNALNTGQTFTVNIMLDTVGQATDGVDILSLHFNPAVLQVVDASSTASGVQIAPGNLFINPLTGLPNPASSNTVNNSTGLISYSQAAVGGTNFTGSGVLATITFTTIAGGTSASTFDAVLGNTTDSNIAFQGSDLLTSVGTGSYVVDVTAPTVSVTAPTSGQVVSGATVTVSGTASDAGSGVASVQFKVDGVSIGTDSSSPYSITWNSTGSINGSHSMTAVATDNAGNQTTSAAVTFTVTNNFSRTFQLDLEGRTNETISGNLSVLSNPAKTLIKTYAYTTNSSGVATVSFDITPATVFLKLDPTPYLNRVMSVDLNNNSTYVFSKLLTGDLFKDNLINTLDYSNLNSKWFTADAGADLNQDGIVNSVDFSYMNSHWLVNGES